MLRRPAALAGEGMESITISAVVGVLTFGMGLLGLYLRRLLPERHMSMGSRDMIAAIMGLLSLLLALVLGTLVGSAHAFFASQKTDIETLCASSLELDLAFQQYGPETQPLRDSLIASVREGYEAIQGDRAAYHEHFELHGYVSRFREWNQILASLTPHSPEQTQALSSIRSISASYQATRLLMSEQLASSISWPLIIIVVAWAMLLFCGFGVLSGLNPTTVAAVAFGAFAVASAIFLILELNMPFSGLFRVPTASIEATLKALQDSPAKG
jgi:hypothetical protein